MDLLEDKEEDSGTTRMIKKELREAMETSKDRLELFQIMAKDNAELKRPQLIVGKINRNSFEMWIDQIPIESTTRFNFLHHQEQLIKQKYMSTTETLNYKFIVEIYHILLVFFVMNQVLLQELINDLQNTGLVSLHRITKLYQNNEIVFK